MAAGAGGALIGWAIHHRAGHGCRTKKWTPAGGKAPHIMPNSALTVRTFGLEMRLARMLLDIMSPLASGLDRATLWTLQQRRAAIPKERGFGGGSETRRRGRRRGRKRRRRRRRRRRDPTEIRVLLKAGFADKNKQSAAHNNDKHEEEKSRNLSLRTIKGKQPRRSKTYTP